jgi:signal transduction histidine kinase
VSARQWSLATRLRLGFGLGAAVIVLVPAAGYIWMVGRTTSNQVEARAAEQLHEFVAHYDTGKPWRELNEVVARLRKQHEETPFAFRVLALEGDGFVHYGDAGPLFDEVETTGRVGDTERIGETVVRATEVTASGAIAECALDGRQYFRGGRTLQIAIAVAAVAAACGSLLVVEVLARRTSGLITRVAQSVRTHPSVRVPLDVRLDHPPEEIREVVEALQRLVERARTEEEKSRLLISGVAHELRAPIQNLVLEGEVALLAPRGVDEYRRVVEDQVELGRELADSVDNLVSLCRGDVEAEHSRHETFDVGREVELRLERSRRGAARQNVVLRLTKRGDLAFEGDREAVLRAVRNLVANAIEWSPPGSTVEIEIAGEADAIEVRVQDRGPGIAPQDRERVFEPFVRLDSGGARRVGYGLGLSIVRRAAELHGGTAHLEERPGGGTVAVLRFARAVTRTVSDT